MKSQNRLLVKKKSQKKVRKKVRELLVPVTDLKPLRRADGNIFYVRRDEAGSCPKCGAKLADINGIEDFHFHDLRHTFASHCIMAGVDITAISKPLGHKSLKMTLRYAHLAPSHLVKAVKMISNKMISTKLAQSF